MKGKKSFTEDLESVFHQTLFEDNLHDNPSMLLQKNKNTKKTTNKSNVVAATANKKEEDNTQKNAKTSRKSFSDNIDIFFKESIEDVLEDTTVTEIKRNVIHNGERKAIGIDVLLQRTSNAHNDEVEASLEPMTKRVTFVLDVDKVEQLKNIAREENKRLRQIVSDLIEEYIKEHLTPPPVAVKKGRKK